MLDYLVLNLLGHVVHPLKIIAQPIYTFLIQLGNLHCTKCKFCFFLKAWALSSSYKYLLIPAVIHVGGGKSLKGNQIVTWGQDPRAESASDGCSSYAVINKSCWPRHLTFYDSLNNRDIHLSFTSENQLKQQKKQHLNNSLNSSSPPAETPTDSAASLCSKHTLALQRMPACQVEWAVMSLLM